MVEKVLVIKLSALGDFLQALGPIEAIRKHHPRASLTLLTTAPFVSLAEQTGFFQEIEVIKRIHSYQIPTLIKYLYPLAREHFSRVYDLQTSTLSTRLFGFLRVMGWRGEFSGIAEGCSHPHKNPLRDHYHTLERQADQLRDAGIENVPFPNVSFLLKKPLSDGLEESLKKSYFLLIPGGAPTRLDKRWPLHQWKTLQQNLAEEGITSILIGGPGEKDVSRYFSEPHPFLINLIGKTSYNDLAHLAQHAMGAIGNDTGPLHLVSLAGCPTIGLFALEASNPRLCGPRGKWVRYIAAPSMDQLLMERVLEAVHILKSVSSEHQSS
jgi:ADP-heptose:LPS heptosyltransferase